MEKPPSWIRSQEADNRVATVGHSYGILQGRAFQVTIDVSHVIHFFNVVDQDTVAYTLLRYHPKGMAMDMHWMALIRPKALIDQYEFDHLLRKSMK